MMKKLVAAIALGIFALVPAFAQPAVGVSIGINQPGVYGRINIGEFPAPRVVYAQPMVVAPSPVAVYQQPVYMYVPEIHQRNWVRYCGRYNACGQPVYFVHEDWVRERYEERRHFEQHGDHWHGDHGHDRGYDRGHW